MSPWCLYSLLHDLLSTALSLLFMGDCQSPPFRQRERRSRTCEAKPVDALRRLRQRRGEVRVDFDAALSSLSLSNISRPASMKVTSLMPMKPRMCRMYGVAKSWPLPSGTPPVVTKTMVLRSFSRPSGPVSDAAISVDCGSQSPCKRRLEFDDRVRRPATPLSGRERSGCPGQSKWVADIRSFRAAATHDPKRSSLPSQRGRLGANGGPSSAEHSRPRAAPGVGKIGGFQREYTDQACVEDSRRKAPMSPDCCDTGRTSLSLTPCVPS